MSRKILARVQSGTAVDEALTMMQSLAWVLDMHFLISTYTKYQSAFLPLGKELDTVNDVLPGFRGLPGAEKDSSSSLYWDNKQKKSTKNN